ncbi:MAG: DUF1853 family protein [Reichenbachiella sp.]
MNTKSRIASILQAKSLDFSITGVPTFDLSALNFETDPDFELPTNVRLGHLIEKIVSELIKASTSFNIHYENIQLIQNKNTIGEIDFIIEDINAKQVIHMELAYKFYLFDPSLSDGPINNWIGPNRNDSLIEKLEKLKRKQFPLLHHPYTQSKLDHIDIDQASQALCFLVSLFIPYEYKASITPDYQKFVKGFYLDFETFTTLDHSTKTYYLPSKKEWGMDPSENETWTDFHGVEKQIDTHMNEKQAPLCWQKHKSSYSAFFIVWW